jgi:hypothetical protein
MTSPQATGTFSVSNRLDPNDSSATFQIVGSVYVPPKYPPPVKTSPVTATLVTNHGSYQPGQSVRLSMTLKNTGAAKVAIARNSALDGITVMDGSTVVFHSSRIRAALPVRSIKPHRSIKLALHWSGRPNQPGITKLSPGTYTVQVVKDGFVGMTNIRLVR